jgi:invasion protein IalB
MRNVRAAMTAVVVALMGAAAMAQTAPKPVQPAPQPVPPSQPMAPSAANNPDAAHWTSRCTAESRRGQQDCVVEQIVPIPATQLFMTVVVRQETDKAEPSISIEVPLGVILQPGMALRLDDGKTQMLPYLFCIDRGCHAGADLSPDMFKAFSLGSHLTAALQTLDKRSFAVPIATTGFAAAFDKIR